jgi:uncharacterized protein (TIGR02145 family)
MFKRHALFSFCKNHTHFIHARYIMKTSRFFTAGALLALAFTFSCSGDDSGGGGDDEPSSSSVSSSSGEPSSSSGNSSSSSGGSSSSETCTNPSSYEAFDIIEIDGKTWMAENLNYAACGSKCYDNDPANCAIYGRLYDWETANTVCPDGWHLPSQAEWDELKDFIENDNDCSDCDAKHLKAVSGWVKDGNGLNSYGFSALPGGDGYSGGLFFGAGYSGNWWSSSEGDSIHAYYRSMDYSEEDANWLSYGKDSLYSVRCLKD